MAYWREVFGHGKYARSGRRAAWIYGGGLIGIAAFMALCLEGIDTLCDNLRWLFVLALALMGWLMIASLMPHRQALG
jgi:hypothetical protein